MANAWQTPGRRPAGRGKRPASPMAPCSAFPCDSDLNKVMTEHFTKRFVKHRGIRLASQVSLNNFLQSSSSFPRIRREHTAISEGSRHRWV